eukprot:TRINITY_DN3453_c1_g1_i2.p1 TRINITY_DN3453_c1_g1~~TRINITY_DN3453_c1_g1_i2.p1  ORF type:complete len:595 (+),score=229.34 TRINITY_DN3453_c1_g1_i2:68-1786(+)
MALELPEQEAGGDSAAEDAEPIHSPMEVLAPTTETVLQRELDEENKWLKGRLDAAVSEREQERFDRVRAQGQLQQRDRRVRKLEKTKQKLKAQVKQQESVLSGTQTELGLERIRVGEQQHEQADLEGKLDALQRDMADMRRALAAKEEEKGKAQLDVERLRVNATMCTAETATVRQEVAHYVSIVNRLQQLCERMREAYNVLKRESKEAAQREDDLKSDIMRLQVSSEEQRRENDLLAGMLRKANEEIGRADREREDLAERLQTAEQEHAEANTGVAHVRAETQMAEFAEMEEELRASLRRINRLEQDLQEAEDAKTECLVSVVDLRGRVQLQEGSIATYCKVNSELESQMAQEQEKAAHYYSLLTDQSARSRSLQEEIHELRGSLDHSQRLLRDLGTEHEEALRAWDVDKATLRRKDEEVMRLQRYFVQVRRLMERRQQEGREACAGAQIVLQRQQAERAMEQLTPRMTTEEWDLKHDSKKRLVLPGTAYPLQRASATVSESTTSTPAEGEIEADSDDTSSTDSTSEVGSQAAASQPSPPQQLPAIAGPRPPAGRPQSGGRLRTSASSTTL